MTDSNRAAQTAARAKRLVAGLAGGLLFLLSAGPLAAMSIRVQNNYDGDVAATAICDGYEKSVTFRDNNTGTYTLNSTSDGPCKLTVFGKTYTVKDGQRIIVKSDGSLDL